MRSPARTPLVRGRTAPGQTRVAPPSDRQLVEAFLREGSDDAFAALHRRHSPALYAFALHQVAGDAALAEELVQDAWVRAVRGLPMFRWDSALRSWLVSILMNGLRTRRRRAARLRPMEDVADCPDASVEPRVAALDVLAALARLPVEFRAVLLLHAIQGFTHGEIGRMLGISEGTSKSRLCRARQVLRGMLRPTAVGRGTA